jgi:hypothetical protein
MPVADGAVTGGWQDVDLVLVWAFSFTAQPQAPAVSQNAVACGLPLNDSINRP